MTTESDTVVRECEHETWSIGGEWGRHISWNGTDIRYHTERRGLLRREHTVAYRLVYGHGMYPRVGDLLESELGLHRISTVQRESSPPDMWTGEADLIDSHGDSDGD